MNFYFETIGDVVELQARLEDGDMLGDTHTEVGPGEDFFDISYDELRKAGDGVVEVDEDGNAEIVEEDEEKAFDPALHPHQPGGSPEGGQWAPTGGGDGGVPEPTPGPAHPLTAEGIMAEAPPAKRNSLSIADVAKQLNERAGKILQAKFGKSSIEESSPETDEYLADAIAEDLRGGLTNGHSSPTWYSDKMKAAMKIAERMHPEIATNAEKRFAYITGMAITSQGEVVDSNVRLAEDTYREFSRTGKFPTDLKVKNSGINVNMKKMNALVERFGLKGTREFFDKEMTVRELKEITGIKVGRSGMDDIVNGSAVLGPKIGLGFYQNLHGNFKPLTMDMWFMRAWGRMTNTGIGQPDMEPIADRLRAALKEEGRRAPANMEALNKIANEIFTQHERDFVKYGDEYKSGARTKTELVYASERFVDSYGGKMVEAPRGAEHRTFITGVFMKALEKLQTKYGIKLEPAAAQATWWNPEKVLYEHLGGRTKDVATDYEKSLRKYEETHGPGPVSAAA